MKPPHAVAEMLEVVGQALRDWCDPLLRRLHEGDDYLRVVRDQIASGPGDRNEVSVHDPSFWLKTFASRNYWPNPFGHHTDSSQRKRAKRLLAVRNEWAHHERADVDWALQALTVARELLRLIGAEREADQMTSIANGVKGVDTRAAAGVEGEGPVEEYDFDAALASAETVFERSLVLDPDQYGFLRRFDSSGQTGPWLVKGGPGSGKTIVALHCIKQLLGGDQQQLSGFGAPKRILFTTYTNALAQSARQMLKQMLTSEQLAQVDVETVDALARRVADRESQTTHRALNTEDLHDPVFRLLRERNINYPDVANGDIPWLVDEYDSYLVGYGATSRDDYLTLTRHGASRTLGPSQRTKIWALFEDLKARREQVPANGKTELLFSEIRKLASESVQPEYDFVVIDEAQDLDPVGVRVAVGLARTPQSVLVMMDPNQSIFGRGLPWRHVSTELSFRGRTTILRRNYRTTQEIWSAARDLADDEDVDALDLEASNRGPKPVLFWHGAHEDWVAQLDAHIRALMSEEGIGADSVAVLSPTERLGDRVARGLGKDLNPRFMRSKRFDPTHEGVKVTTIHAAKGMGFPAVAVVGVGGGTLPSRGVTKDSDHMEFARQQRQLFVACTRAMNRLLVVADGDNRSPLLGGIDPGNWDTQQL